MSTLYALAEVSRQGHFQDLERRRQRTLQEERLLAEVARIRTRHPRMGARKIHRILSPVMGRDRFEALLLSNGFRVGRVRNYARTTHAHPSIRMPNLIEGLVVVRPDQLWVSDITYVPYEGRFFYVCLITDVYSRRILGSSASRTLAAEANLRALRQALRTRGGTIPPGLIHHSDRGSQYVAKEYLALLARHQARASMGDKAWKNAHAERMNGILKNEYILPLGFKGFTGLVHSLASNIRKHNTERPSEQLPGWMTPCAFEDFVANHPEKNDYKVEIKY
ncbi:MAG TPA: IS3 family transposase [Flavobacteriales bacterium]|jgi:transposase InsO family protein|nr:IS3 family transposase [Flavobacteriales bacterium]